MLRETEKQFSFHSMLYNKIPEDHLLKVVDRAVDFSFINPLVAGSYCKNFGRPAKEPAARGRAARGRAETAEKVCIKGK